MSNTERKPVGKRRCAFCGAAGVNREHVWPKWLCDLAKELAAEAELGPFENFRGHATRPGKSLEGTARHVCEKCNSGWMSDLENQAKPVVTPLILGAQSRPISLTPAEQLIVARWSFKTAIVLDFAYMVRSLRDAVASQFFIDRRPPNNCAIMIAAYGGGEPSFGVRFFDTTVTLSNFSTVHGIFIPDSNPLVQPAVLVSVQVLQFLVQILLFDGLGFPHAAVRIEDSKVLRIWPPQSEAIVWPPHGGTIDDNGVRKFLFRRARIRMPNL